MNEEWNVLYKKAMEIINPHQVSDHMSVGGVASAIQTESGAIYTGICIDTSSSLGMCAERNALSTMLSQGENKVRKVVSVYQDGHVMPSCGACREFMMQLGVDPEQIEILLDNGGRTATLKDLMPEYPY